MYCRYVQYEFYVIKFPPNHNPNETTLPRVPCGFQTYLQCLAGWEELTGRRITAELNGGLAE